MLNMRKGERTTAPAGPLMDYETGRGDTRKLALATGMSALGIAVIFPVGAALAIFCRQPVYGDWSKWALLGHIVGWALGVLGIVVAAVPVSDYLLDAALHRQRQRKAFDLELALRKTNGGVVVQETFEEFQFYAERPNDMLLIVTALTRRAATDSQFRPSIGTLVDDGIWVGNRKLGNVNSNQARKILGELADMGFIVGRENGTPGTWAYQSVDDAVERFERARR